MANVWRRVVFQRLSSVAQRHVVKSWDARWVAQTSSAMLLSTAQRGMMCKRYPTVIFLLSVRYFYSQDSGQELKLAQGK